MTSKDDQGFLYYRSPSSIRNESFSRRMRGLDADEVYEYLDLLADQIEAADGERRGVREENERLKAENESLQAELERVRGELTEFEQVGDKVNEQVVQLFSQAQLVAEEMVEDVSRDARQRLGQAREQERKIVQEAVHVAEEQVRNYARSAQSHMQSIMDSFAFQVEQVGDGDQPRRSGTRDYQNGSWSPEGEDWQIEAPRRNGSSSWGSD